MGVFLVKRRVCFVRSRLSFFRNYFSTLEFVNGMHLLVKCRSNNETGSQLLLTRASARSPEICLTTLRSGTIPVIGY